MASTEEEPLALGQQHVLAAADPEPEPEPFSPSVFLDLPPTPPGPDGDDLVLPFISRMLMEDDIHDSFFYRYPDHPALLQALQPFADILSDATAPTPLPVPPDANTVELSQLNQGGDANALLPADGDRALLSGFNREDADMVNLAFLKGMEEANRFLPTNDGLLGCCKQPTKMGGGKNNRRRTLQQDDDPDEAETSRRRSKLMAPEPEETGEMVDQVALNVLSSCLKDIESLRITAGGEQVDKKNTGKKKKKQQQPAHEAGDLHTLLLHCAQAVGMNDRRSATQLLGQIRERSSPSGDANQQQRGCLVSKVFTLKCHIESCDTV